MAKTGIVWIKRIALTLAVLLLAVSSLFLIGNLDALNIMPFARTFYWESPSYVIQRDGIQYIVDSSKTRISILDEEGRITKLIYGTSAEDSFSNTDYIACDGTYLYVADVVYASSGTRVSEEHIKKFTLDGEYVSTVFTVQYEPGKYSMPAQNGYIVWMGSYESDIWFIYYDKETLSINRLHQDGFDTYRTFEGELPEIWNIAYSVTQDALYLIGKDSLIYRESDEKNRFERVDTLPYDERSIFSDIDAAGDSIYATDLGLRQVVDVTTGHVVIGTDDPTQNALIYRVSAAPNGVAVTDNVTIWAANAEAVTYCEDSAPYAPSLYATVLLTWSCLAILVVALLIFLGAMLVSTLRGGRSKYTATSLIVAAAILIATAAISTTLLTDTFTRLTETSLSALVRTADVISASSATNGIGDAVKDINSIADYGNASHQYLQSYMDAYCDAAYNTGSNMYYVVFKLAPEQDLVYGITDYEKTAGAIYPYCPYEGSDYQTTAETGEIISVGMSMDAYGAWSFAVAPLFDSDGQVSAVVELGINMQTEQAQNYDLILSIIVRIAVIILLILLFLIEGTVLVDSVSKFRHEADANIPYFLRPMMFLTFFASNLSAAFIPQMSLVLYTESGLGANATFASALPMSIQLFAIAIAALMAGRLLLHFSMRGLMIISCAIQIAGYICIGLASLTSDYIFFCGGHLLSGLGIGVVVVSLNTLPDRIEDEGLRGNYYAGLNAGIISGVVIGSSVGSYISDLFGHSATFFVSAGVVLLVALLIWISVKRGVYTSASSDEIGETRVSTLRFLTSKDVWSFLICVMVPMLILLYFKDYLFPMYGYDSGMDDVSIGNILLFAGAASIVFGTTISDWLFKHCGTLGTVIISSSLICGTLILFGLFPSVETAITAVVILSLATGFGLAAQEVFYSSLPIFRGYGAQRSMSIYSICDNISQAIGPLLLGGMLIFGYASECFLLGIGGLILLALFLLIQLIFKKRKER